MDPRPRLAFRTITGRRGQQHHVPDRLPLLGTEQATATVTLPVRLNWSEPGRTFHLSRRADRARVYEIVLREGGPADIEAYVDGALLADLWTDLVLPADLRAGWEPLMAEYRTGRADD